MKKRTVPTTLITLIALVVFITLPLAASAQPARDQGTGEAITPEAIEACQFSSTITSDFNGTPLSAGNSIWFNSHLKVSGLKGREAVVHVRDAMIRFSANGVTYQLPVEPSEIHFAPATDYSFTVYDEINLHWITEISRANLGNNVFAGGYIFVVPAGGLPGGIKPVTWTATITTDTPGLKVAWQWSAAVYTPFGQYLNELGVKEADGPEETSFADATKAGTPWYLKEFVTGGARGGGGSNYTGSWSGTGSLVLCVE